MHIKVETTDGNTYECNVPPDTRVDTLAADFFESMDWPTQDNFGRGQRAVVELVSADNPDQTIRLRGNQTLAEANITGDVTVRIFPEAIAGSRIDDRRRITTLILDHRKMKSLAESNDFLEFETNKENAPTIYSITFKIESFIKAPYKEGERPETAHEHKVEIGLPATYPKTAPVVFWTSPIFHPNISPDGRVCLGQLNDQYLPGLGLARIVTILAEILRWRNYDIMHPFNPQAAAWASNPKNWNFISDLGGAKWCFPFKTMIDPDNWGNTQNEEAPFKGTAQPDILKQLWQREKNRHKITFQPYKKVKFNPLIDRSNESSI